MIMYDYVYNLYNCNRAYHAKNKSCHVVVYILCFRSIDHSTCRLRLLGVFGPTQAVRGP